jgi:iron complex outermembrane receptor protein
MKKHRLIALAATLLPVLAFAQFSISGKISDNKGRGLPGASIELANSVIATQTNNSGNFLIGNLRPGDYTIRFNYVGFNTKEQKISLVRDVVLELELERSNFLTDEVIVSALRADDNSATTFRNLKKEDLEKNNLGQDLPYLLNQTPSAVVSSDAGAGVGYTGIRIRGSDPTRINLTINGIPYNDSESQGSFLVNIPDFASSVDNIQIQRGVGTSTNGAGAFGASINMQTNTRKDSAYTEINNSYGSFETWKNTVSVGTGLIKNKWNFDGRLSRIKSNGYIDRASSNLKSYFLSGAFYGKNDLLRVNVFSGTEKTYQAWNGVPEALLSTNRRFNGFEYDDQTDNYSQDHYQLLYSHSFSSKLNLNTALHYTHGRGFYEEYREDASLSGYGITPVLVGGATISESDVIRRRWLNNDFYGLTYSLNYRPMSDLNFTLGGAYNEYDGDHFGEVIWAEFASTSKIRQRYYNGNGFKTDFNVFAKANYQLGALTLSGDLQYRNLNYSITGTDKNRNTLDFTDKIGFFNPKAGLSYHIKSNQNAYVSFAVGNKEPNRDDFINAGVEQPKSERLNNIELGYRLNGNAFSAGINGYGMFYKDQLVLTGKINDVGEYIRQNVPESYRVGVELDTRWQFANNIAWNATVALSTNKVENFTEFVDDYDNGGQIVNNFKNTNIAFSPSFVGSSEFTFRTFKRVELAFLTKYVSRQYLDNTSNSARTINSFFANDVRLRYQTSIGRIDNVGMTLLVNNVLNELYETNGYTFSYNYLGTVTTENFYFPQASRNFLLSMSLKF